MNATLRLALVLVGGALMAGPVGFFFPSVAGVGPNELQWAEPFHPLADFRQLYLLCCLFAGMLMVLAAVRFETSTTDRSEGAPISWKRYVRAVVAGCVAGAALGAIAWFLTPAPYTAFSELQISSVQEKILFETAEEHVPFENYKQTQMTYVTSPFVLNAALRNPQVSNLPTLQQVEEPAKWLEKNLSVSSPAQEFVRISLSGERPKDLAAIVNAITDAYLEEVVNVDSLKRQKRLEQLRKIQRQREEELRAKQNSLKALRQSMETGNSTQADAKQQYLYELHLQMRKELSKIYFDLMKAKLQLATITNGVLNIDETTADGRRVQINTHLRADSSSTRSLSRKTSPTRRYYERPGFSPIIVRVTETIDGEAQTTEYSADDLDELREKHPAAAEYYDQFVTNRRTDIPDSIVEAHLSQEPEFAELRKKIRQKERALREFETQAADDSELVPAKREELEQLRQDLAKLHEEIRPRVIEQIEYQLTARNRAEEEQLRQQIAMLEAEESILKQQLEDVKVKEKKTGMLSFELESLAKEMAQSESILNTIVDEIHKLTVEVDSPTRIKLHRVAEVPGKRDLRARTVATGLAGLFGFLLAFAAVSHRRQIAPPAN